MFQNIFCKINTSLPGLPIQSRHILSNIPIYIGQKYNYDTHCQMLVKTTYVQAHFISLSNKSVNFQLCDFSKPHQIFFDKNVREKSS